MTTYYSKASGSFTDPTKWSLTNWNGTAVSEINWVDGDTAVVGYTTQGGNAVLMTEDGVAWRYIQVTDNGSGGYTVTFVTTQTP